MPIGGNGGEGSSPVCPVKGCGRIVLPSMPYANYTLCERHGEMAAVFEVMMNRVQAQKYIGGIAGQVAEQVFRALAAQEQPQAASAKVVGADGRKLL